MKDFVALIVQIFIIVLIQIIFEAFVDTSKKPYQAMVINIAFFLGSLYLLVDFIFNNIIKNINTIVHLPF